MAAAEPEQLQDDHQSGDVARQRVAQAGAVRQDQIGLKLGQPVVGMRVWASRPKPVLTP